MTFEGLAAVLNFHVCSTTGREARPRSEGEKEKEVEREAAQRSRLEGVALKPEGKCESGLPLHGHEVQTSRWAEICVSPPFEAPSCP